MKQTMHESTLTLDFDTQPDLEADKGELALKMNFHQKNQLHLM